MAYPVNGTRFLFSYLEYSTIMKNAKDKKLFRMQMVQYAKDHGNKPAARAFKTTVKTVRKWRKRYVERAPHNNSIGKIQIFRRIILPDLVVTRNGIQWPLHVNLTY